MPEFEPVDLDALRAQRRDSAYTDKRTQVHDHRDTTPYGYTVLAWQGTKRNAEGEFVQRTHRLPVPAYHFTCEGCRQGKDLAGVADTCDVWTAAGARFRRAHPELFPGQLPLLMDDDDLDPNGVF